jgi:hypothetical protein
MPRGDGTGPRGSGPMTGRGMGLYAGSGNSGFFPRRGRALGLLGLGMWLVRLWSTRKRMNEGLGEKNDETSELKRTRNRQL